MKTILFALALLATSAQAADKSAIFQSPGGCVWRTTGGSCMVSNVTNYPIVCDISTKVESSMSTAGHAAVTNHVVRARVSIAPKQVVNSSVAPNPGQSLITVGIKAVCTVQG